MTRAYTVPLSSIVQVLTQVGPQLSSVDAATSSSLMSSLTVSSVTSDSRQVSDGALFVAVTGDTLDGHQYIGAAIEAGAVAALGSRSRNELATMGVVLPDGFPYFPVTNTRFALAEASAALYGYPSRSIVVIGVTGTDGKTTTCTLLESILVTATRTEQEPHGRVGVITTVGARIRGEEQETGFHVTTPDAPEVQRYLAQIRDTGCDFAILESTSHGLAQARVAAIEYDVAAVTNITHEHLDYHGTRDAYVQAKALLFRALYADSDSDLVDRFAVLNADDDGSYRALQDVLREEAGDRGNALPVRTYRIAPSNGSLSDSKHYDVVAENVEYSPSSTRVSLRWWGGAVFDVESNLIGQFNVQNILCAASVALGLGIEPLYVQQGIAELQGITGRMERIDCGQPFLAVIDFAHSPVSLERALQTLRPLVSNEPGKQSGKLIAVFGCAGLRDRKKRRLMGQVSGRHADFTVITAEDPRTEDLAAINQEIESGVREFSADAHYRIIPDRTEAIEYAVRIAQPGDVVAAFGKGHERSMCFGNTEYPWSDQQAMRDALNKRNRQAETVNSG